MHLTCPEKHKHAEAFWGNKDKYEERKNSRGLEWFKDYL